MGTFPMAAGELVGHRALEAHGDPMRISIWPIVLPITEGRALVAVVRYGWVGTSPVHAGACALCWSGLYDCPEFDGAVRWLFGHLGACHAIASPWIDAGQLPPHHRQVARLFHQILLDPMDDLGGIHL